MTINAVGFYFTPALSLVVAIALLALQVRAFRRHRHTSFLLLLGATLCGLIYVISFYALSYFAGHGDLLPESIPASWPYIATTLQIIEPILGLWGIASLFRSYDQLAAAASATSNHRSRGP